MSENKSLTVLASSVKQKDLTHGQGAQACRSLQLDEAV